MNNYDYPVGADNDPEAPWNEKSNKPKKVEVTVSITLSKTVEVEVDDYTTEETNEDGCHGVTYYFDESNLERYYDPGKSFFQTLLFDYFLCQHFPDIYSSEF